LLAFSEVSPVPDFFPGGLYGAGFLHGILLTITVMVAVAIVLSNKFRPF